MTAIQGPERSISSSRNVYIPVLAVLRMTNYVACVWSRPNPSLESEPTDEGWCDSEVDGSHTLAGLRQGTKTTEMPPRVTPGTYWAVQTAVRAGRISDTHNGSKSRG